MSISDGMGEHWGGFLSGGIGVSLKWEKVVVGDIISICPKCGIVLEGNLYSTKDVFEDRYIIRCRRCYQQVEKVGKHWVRVKQWYEP